MNSVILLSFHHMQFFFPKIRFFVTNLKISLTAIYTHDLFFQVSLYNLFFNHKYDINY